MPPQFRKLAVAPLIMRNYP